MNRLLLASVPALLAGCLSAPDSPSNGETGLPDDTGTGPGAALEISVTGELDTCEVCQSPPDLSLTFVTPPAYQVGFSDLELAGDADFTDPVTVFSSDTPDVLEIAGTTRTLEEVDVGALPTGTYTHARFRLTHQVFQVEALGHLGANDLDGTLALDVALADYTGEEGTREQGDIEATFSYATASSDLKLTDVPLLLGEYPDPTDCFEVDVAGAGYALVLDLTHAPVVLGPDAPEQSTLELVLYLQEAFGWRDDSEDGVFDVSTSQTHTELPEFFYPRGYALTHDGDGCS